jgi:hypothetical protein
MFGRGPIYFLTRAFMHCLFGYIRKKYIGFSEFEEFRLSEKISKIAGYVTVIVYAALFAILAHIWKGTPLIRGFSCGLSAMYLYLVIRGIILRILSRR